MITFPSITDEQQIAAVSQLADEIWREHYAAILSAGQIDYMLATLQSPAAIAQQISHGYQYYFIAQDAVPAGYLALRMDEDSAFLSKLYVRGEFRRRGLARAAVALAASLAAAQNKPEIRLSVNRHNAGSIAAYRALGFTVRRQEVSDIGDGYVMDDYVMALPVGPAAPPPDGRQ